MDSKNNTFIWDKYNETDPKYTKKVKYGKREFTTVNAQYQIGLATSEWGPYGDKWGIKSYNYKIIDLHEDQKLCHVSAIFYYPKAEFEISSSILIVRLGNNGLQIDDEFAKKIETDILTKSLSKLGFNRDIFEGMYDDNMYVNQLKEKFETHKKPIAKALNKDLPFNERKNLEYEYNNILEDIVFSPNEKQQYKFNPNWSDKALKEAIRKVSDMQTQRNSEMYEQHQMPF